ncbi:MAG: DASS family sodium-coupled anion symporter [Thaumarchaeota archaeon]|nr:DASS family sodium-coupled anion symporter [Nitrososphaerota archaeon]
MGTSDNRNEKKERPWSTRRLAGMLLGPVLFAFIYVSPLDGVNPEAKNLAAVFAWAVTYWVAEVIPPAFTALLSSAMAILIGVAPAETVLASYSDPVIFLFVGSFILAKAFQTSGLAKRFAIVLLSQSWATRSPFRVMATIGVVTWFISLWVSNTATTAMMLPVGIGLLAAMGPVGDLRYSKFPVGLMLMLTWASSVAVGTPVGSPPNLIAIGMIRSLAGRQITFFDWAVVMMPISIMMLLLCYVLLRLFYGGKPRQDDHRSLADEAVHQAGKGIAEYVSEQRKNVGPWSRAEVNVLLVFIFAVTLWVLPGVISTLYPEQAIAVFFQERFPEVVVALIAAGLLLLLPVDLKRGVFTITGEQAIRIDWGTILFFGGGLALGRLMFETGLARIIGEFLVKVSGAQSLWALTAIAIALGVVLSETSSNTASASMVIPILIGVSTSIGVSPIPPAMGAALGASFGFMLPISTPPNAIAYGSGMIPLKEMIRSGFVLDVVGVIVIWAGLRVLCPLFGVI